MTTWGPSKKRSTPKKSGSASGLVEEVDDLQACDQGVVEDLVEDTGGVVIAFEVVRQRP